MTEASEKSRITVFLGHVALTQAERKRARRYVLTVVYSYAALMVLLFFLFPRHVLEVAIIWYVIGNGLGFWYIAAKRRAIRRYWKSHSPKS
jgi:hypothetical protein